MKRLQELTGKLLGALFLLSLVTALSVALQSQHPYEAWQFAHFMTAGAGNIPYLYATLRPAARRDLIEQQKNDPDLNAFAVQALTPAPGSRPIPLPSRRSSLT